jgi:hypothetical protein
MSSRITGPSKAFLTRDAHRRALTLHFVAWMVVLAAGFFANRTLTPDRFWLGWVGLAAAIALGVHGAIFARSTLATMGGKK